MTEPTELLPCPFCGANAHFEMDDARWEWVECESCGMQSNRSMSIMEDCRPMLVTAWNARAKWGQPAHSGEPYGCVTTHRGTGQRFFYRYPEPPYLDNTSECVTVYTAPQPVEREPLTDEQSHALLHRMADESDKWAEGLSYEPTREQVSGWCVAFLMRELPAHGIKGGQHGTNT